MNQDESTRVDLGDDLLAAPVLASQAAKPEAPIQEKPIRDQISTAQIWAEEKLYLDAKEILWALKRRALLGGLELSVADESSIEQVLLKIQAEELKALLHASSPVRPSRDATPDAPVFQGAVSAPGIRIERDWLTFETSAIWDLLCALGVHENLHRLSPVIAELERRFAQESDTQNQRALSEWFAEAALRIGDPVSALNRLNPWVVDQSLSDASRAPLVYWLIRAYEAMGESARAAPWKEWILARKSGQHP